MQSGSTVDSGSWQALPPLQGSVFSLASIDFEGGTSKHGGRRYQDSMRAQPCLVAGGQFGELQTKVVRLCLQALDKILASNTTSTPDAGTTSTCSNAFQTPFGAFSDAWEPVLMPENTYADAQEALVVSSFFESTSPDT